MTAFIGGKTDSSSTSLTDGKGFNPGDRYVDHAGKEWVFVKASASIGQYDVATYDETYVTTVAGVSTSNDARGDKIGVAAVDFASSAYGWLQIYGPCTMNVKASVSANARLNTTATAGYPDSSGTSGSFQLEGIYLTAARTASDGSAAGVLNYPITGTVL
jgi:hypothetical protein